MHPKCGLSLKEIERDRYEKLVEVAGIETRVQKYGSAATTGMSGVFFSRPVISHRRDVTRHIP